MMRGIIITTMGGKPPILPDVTNPIMSSKTPTLAKSTVSLAISTD